MLKRFLLLTIATLVMLPVLADKPDDTGNKGGSGVLLDVSFRDHFTTGFGTLVRVDRFGSDGFAKPSPAFAPYINGDDSVSAHIDKFRFGLNVGMNGPRHFYLDLTDCEPLEPCSAPGLAGNLTYGWNVFAISPDGAQYLKMGFGDAHSQLVNFQLEFFDTPDRERNWRIMFNPSLCAEYINDSIAMAKVTRVANDIWVFEAGADDYACLELRKGGRKHYTYHGRYRLPFKIIATAQ